MEANSWDVVIVGGGVAGLSAALMLGRARRRVLVLDGGEPRNRFATHMHGVLGHEGVDPARLLATGRDEAASYGIRFAAGIAARIDETDGGVSVTLADGAVHRGRAVIVATGLSDELPDVPGLAQRWGRSVLHCPYCHGWEVRDQRLGVLATSPLAVHQAELVRQWSERVTFFTAVLGTLEPAVERRLRARGITLVPAPVVEVLGEGDRITGVRTASGEVVPIDAIFTAAALRPHDGFLAHLGLARTDGPVGSFLTVDPTGKTSSERIWAVGNVANPMANVPMSVSAGALAGATVNMALVTAEFDAAEAAAGANAEPTVTGF
jgi:thioredoxin reductase